MYQFIGLCWNHSDQTQNELVRSLVTRLMHLPTGWREVLRSPGMVVFHSGVRPASLEAFLLPNGRGVVLGNIFAKSTFTRMSPGTHAFTAAQSNDIVSTRGRALIEDYWGRFVAFVQGRDPAAKYVVADACGGLPCLMAVHNGISLFFSRPQVWVDLGLPALSVNWDYIEAHVMLGALRTRESGLSEISEVVGGECVALSSSSVTRTLYWEPMKLCQSDIVESVDDAVRLLRATVDSCVHALASCHRGILHTLSGGLDSSIVLASLARAPSAPRLTCVNYVTEDPEGDEREFARAAVARTHSALIEVMRDSSATRYDRMLSITPFVRPWSYRYSVEHTSLECELAREHGATATFSGSGGDQVFCNTRVETAVPDFFYHRGIRPRLAAVAWDVARVQRTSLWPVLWKGLRNGFARRSVDVVQEFSNFSPFSSKRAVDSAWLRRFTAPWLVDQPQLPQGKVWQTLFLSIPSNFYDPIAREDSPERIAPLIAQPVIELVLQIPTYVCVFGGWDRAVARRAFFGDVPDKIIQRRTKGGLGDHASRVLQKNMPFIRELLLDGELLSHGVVDRTKVERILRSDEAPTTEEFLGLEDCLSIEVWLRCWTGQRYRAAA